ncbi:MAG TPA: hypothetical protein VKN73_05330 [Desulfosalsimonadaceae bacterium]|nr:hypothetical protein [Desulfosalsimonadaceae bacterium]
MGALDCFGDKVSAFFIGVLLLIIGIAFVIVSFTVLPIFGLIVAIPAFIASVPFLRNAFRAACDYYGW